MEKRRGTRVLARVAVAEVATVEELAGLKAVLKRAGFIVVAQGRELAILVVDR